MMDEGKIYKSFLGTGWSFPPSFSKTKKGIIMVSDEEDIKQSLNILLSTSLGERVMQPEYGCELTGYVFETLNASIKADIRNLVERAILFHEPRIKVDNITLEGSDDVEGTLYIVIDYTIITTNNRSNYVYPFYINEGTNITK
jgi:phage baseplate assembly protein W